MVLYACYYCFTAPIKASPFEHSCSRCVILLLAFKFSRELNSNMPSCISKEVTGCLNSLENWEVRRQLSIPELPSRSPSPYFAPLRCLLRIIASFTSPLTRYLCQFYVSFMSVLCRFYVGFMSVLCQFNVFLYSANLLIISDLPSRLCRMSVVFAFFISSNYFLLADSCPFPSDSADNADFSGFPLSFQK